LEGRGILRAFQAVREANPAAPTVNDDIATAPALSEEAVACSS